MEETVVSCPIPVNAKKSWPYQQYYIGETDQEQRRNGHGQNHWSGAESLEWYTGKFVRDMMHGEGEYRRRYHGPEGTFVSYEGQFYGNRMHGYGVMSYPDGRVFNGLYYHNMRWGPGIESMACLEENVGLWRGNHLVRLTWQPSAPSVALDLGPIAETCVEPYRSLLTTRVHNIGEVNNTIELLKQCGADPVSATDNWTKFYPKHCTDLDSQLCHIELFDYEYYRNTIIELEEINTMPVKAEGDDTCTTPETYFAWNNSHMIVSMMKHCFKHETQRTKSGIDLKTILCGPRSQYKNAAKHELNCRTLIMASYLGDIKSVARLINEENVHPDVADILGNTALMYATCGNQANVVHFLMEAGANVNSFNDSCCTPLGVALTKFACISRDIGASDMVQALIPSTTIAEVSTVPTFSVAKALEWHIVRDMLKMSSDKLSRGVSKTNGKMFNVPKKSISILMSSEKFRMTSLTTQEEKCGNDDYISEDKQHFVSTNAEFLMRVSELFSIPTVTNPIPCLFEVSNIVKEMDAMEEGKGLTERKSNTRVNKVPKDTSKPSKENLTRQGSKKEVFSINSTERVKMEMLSQSMSTILQLLSDGADPRLVRCPQSALWIALASYSPELVKHLVNYSADINEVYPKVFNYTLLDIALSQPLTYKNLALIRAILECGARTDHRLEYPKASDCSLPVVLGPTLLHAVVAKNVSDETEEEIRCQLLELLLIYNCNPLTQFKGCSAMDLAMMTNMEVFNVFISCPKTDLNAVINDCNQTVLVKMFSLQFISKVSISERLQTLTNLLLYGADPLLECQDGEVKYANIFAYAKQTIYYLESNMHNIQPSAGDNKADPKSKKGGENPKKETNIKLGSNDIGDYKQASDLVRDCARILHKRWIQAKLLKELIEIVIKYEHRHWNMILPEHKNKKACGFWLSTPRSLEIWDIFKNNRKKKFNYRRILKHVLCIVHFNSIRSKTTFKWPLTTKEKHLIEFDVNTILHERKITADKTTDNARLTRQCVTPELDVGAGGKFEVCFECALPFENQKILCIYCKQLSFCSFDCMKMNIDKNIDCHPCNEYLKVKYFPSTVSSQTFTPLSSQVPLHK